MSSKVTEMDEIINTSIDDLQDPDNLDLVKIQCIILSKLGNKNISTTFFFNYVNKQIMNIISEIKTKNFELSTETYQYFYNISHIFTCIKNSCIIEQLNTIMSPQNITSLLNSCISVFNYIDNENISNNNLLNPLFDCIFLIMNNILDINTIYVLELLLNVTDNSHFNTIFSLLSKEPHGRKFIYEKLKKNYELNISSNSQLTPLYKEKQEEIANHLLLDLCNSYKNEDVKIIINDLKPMINIFINNLNKISNNLLNLLIKICESYKENDDETYYDDIFSFFFDEIVFPGNDKSKFNKVFLNMLFDLYSYLITDINNKKIYTLFLSKFFSTINMTGNGKIRYTWLLQETNYESKILNSFAKICDENIIVIYFILLTSLSMQRNNNDQYYLPEHDLILFFNQLKIYLLYSNKKENLIKLISDKIYALIDFNKKIINILLNKCKLFENILNIVDSKEFEKEKQLKLYLLELFEKILLVNGNKFDYIFNIPLREEINEINMKINVLLIEFERDNNNFNKKISKIIEMLNNFTKNKKIYEFIKLSKVIFETIINFKFKNINIITDDSLNNLNNLFMQISFIFANDNDRNDEDKIEEYLCEFFDEIFKFIFELNKKIFDYKIARETREKLSSMIYTKKIITKETVKEILTKLLISQNLKIRKKAFDYLINYAIDSKIKMIISPWIINVMIKIFYEVRNYKNLKKIYSILLECINFSNISVKILLNFNFVSITINILEDLVDKIEDEEFFNIVKNFLEEIIKYLNSELLMKYLQSLFMIYNNYVLSDLKAQTLENNLSPRRRTNIRENSNDENLTNFQINITSETCEDNNISEIHEDNNDNIDKINEEVNKEKKKKLCLELFNLIKKNILNYQKNQNIYENNYNYIVLSNTTYPCHLIYNMLYVDNLKYNKEKDSYILFKLFIKISYNFSSNCYLYKFQNGSMKLEIFLNNKKELIIREKKEKNMEVLQKIPDFDKILPADSKFHDFVLIFNTQNKRFTISIDTQEKIENIKYKNFDFSNFNIVIGFTYKSIIEREECNNNYCLIYISYFLVLNFLTENESLNEAIKTHRKNSINGNLLNTFFGGKNKNICSNIITEIDFKNSNINLTTSNTLKNKSPDDLQKFLKMMNNVYNNKLVPFIKVANPYNEKNRFTNLYLLSKNKNIYEYYSYNYFFELETLHKETISSEIFDSFNLISSCCNYFVVDFLIGFIFLTEKNLEKLKNSGKLENFEKNENNSVFLLNSQQSEFIYVNEDILIEYLLSIFEIIFYIPDNKIKKYFLYENKIQMKIKMFFYRNITLLNNNEIFVEKLLKIITKEKNTNKIKLNDEEFLLNFLVNIFFDFLIYEKLEFCLQNTILNQICELLNNSDFNNESKIDDILFTLFNNLINILLCCKLTFIENNEGKTQLDLILNCIFSIANKLMPNNKIFEEKICRILIETKITCLQFSQDIETHPISGFLKKFQNFMPVNKDIYDNEETNDNYLPKNELLQLCNQINNIPPALNNFFNKNNKSSSNSNNIKIIDCYFCNYLKIRFSKQIYFLFDNIKYEKIIMKYFRNLYLNFDNLNFDKTKYSWFISQKESCNKLQNKLFLKENHIKGIVNINPKTNKKTNSYFYDYNKIQYLTLFQQFHLSFIFDKLCKHKYFIDYLYPKSDIVLSMNCLCVNKLHKILSIFVLYENKIKIYQNFFLDNDNKINVARRETSHILWTKQKDDYKKELSNYINENDNAILEEIYAYTNPTTSQNKTKEKKKTKTISKFCYNNSYKFSIKTINLEKITEMYKRKHLHIPNSLEIFTKNGASYFIVTPIYKRDLLFNTIIQKINDIITKKKNKTEIKNIKNSFSNDMEIYFKHCPIYLLKNDIENEIKKSKKTYKPPMSLPSIIDGNILLNEAYNFWIKNKISNFDYLNLLNTLSGRSLNDISQYFIFPWIIKDFNMKFLNWLSDTIYRDLSLPLFACGEDKERIIKKYELLDDEKYHCGTFYSTHAFVAYYLIRQHPYTEIHLEIQGGHFDTIQRLFNDTQQLSSITEKFQELIPSIFYLPELYIKINQFFDNDIIKEPINDFDLPYWSKNDPRKFTLILLKMLENKKISQNLHLWIDLIFGNKQRGQNAFKALNVFRNACYELSKQQIEKLDKQNELEGILFEKEELGLVGNQLFTKPHKQKEILNEFNEFTNTFFDSNLKLRGLKLIKIKNEKFNKKKIPFRNIENIIFDTNSQLYIENINNYHQGGISSLRSLMNSFYKNYPNQISKNPNNFRRMSSCSIKIKDLLEKENNFLLLSKNFKILGPKNIIVTFDSQYIELIDIINNRAFFYYLNEISEITSVTVNEKGTYLYVGFNLGFIIQYKILTNKEINSNRSYTTEIISPFHIFSKLSNESFEYNNIYKINLNDFNTQQEIKLNYLEKISKNNFTYNNPHNSKKIILLSLNEAHNILIACDITTTIYIISLSKKFCLMHIVHYLTNIKYKIKEIIPLQKNGDFIIYTPLSVYLFSINGVPLCQLSLLDKVHESLSYITCCRAVFLYDVILFTGHKEGYIIIWRISNKNMAEKFDERASFLYNRIKSKYFLPEYYYGYNSKNNKNKIDEFEMQRKFEIISKINIDDGSSMSLDFMKISNKMDYMLVIDKDKNLYVLTNFDEIKEKVVGGSGSKKSGKECSNCKKEIKDEFYRPTLMNTEEMEIAKDDKEENGDKNKVSNKKKKKFICEECKQKLEHTENFLYNY